MKESTRKRLESVGLLAPPDRTPAERRRDALWTGLVIAVAFVAIRILDTGFFASLLVASVVAAVLGTVRGLADRKRDRSGRGG
jgi:uncharacterized membrane protein